MIKEFSFIRIRCVLRSLRIVAETLWNLRRNTSPWQRATVAQNRLTIRGRNPEISTPIGVLCCIVFSSKLAMPREAVRRDGDEDLRQTFKTSQSLMITSTSRIFARPAKQWGVAGGRVCTSTTFFWTILLCDAAVAQLYRGKLLPLTPGSQSNASVHRPL